MSLKRVLKPTIIKDDIYRKHNTKEHPESILRVDAIYKKIEYLIKGFNTIKPKKATVDDILTVHTKEHVSRVKDASLNESYLDGDTPTSKDSYNVALYAAGAGISAVDAIYNNLTNSVFAIVRPPGHHATSNRAMGFCLFNNIAISARYAQKRGYEKVFIIDFDVHHGNGTQDIFYRDKSVFYFSTHQAFTYPGSGNPDEIGVGEGKGYTFNYPLMPNSTDKELLEVYNDELPKLIDNFNPDIILVSAGYDLHESDPLAALDITHSGIESMVKRILTLSNNKPIIFFLEGGYEIDALAKNVEITLKAMLT